MQNTQQMKKLRGFKELHWMEKAFFALFLSIGMLYNFGTYLSIEGRGLPAEADLNYTSGRVGSTVYGRSRHRDYYYLTLTDTTSKKTTLFSCANATYSMFEGSKNCFQNEEYGTHGTVGWYYAPDILWFKNDMPQLVTLTIDGKEIRSYDKTLGDIKSENIIDIFLAILYSILNFYLAVRPCFEHGEDSPDDV